MSQDFDSEIFADFIVESREHLETIEPNLLELEKAPDNLSLINEIFRPMHSLKGASGFMGLNRMNVLAHRAENVLDEMRKGSMSVNSEIMDVILSATDALRQMLDNLEASGKEGDVPTEPIIAVLDSIMAGGGSAAPAPVQAPAPSPAAAPPPAPAPSPMATPRKDPAEWIESLPVLPSYALSAFGMEHLKDFIDEARENTSNIGDGLLVLEKHPDEHGETVNDMFRYFHNIKGNSGIIGYQEVNGLTHEAETLLNLVRKDELPVTPPLVDILFLVVDVLESLLARIDLNSGQVNPFDAGELLESLRQATSGGAIELPTSLLGSAAETASQPSSAPQPAAASASDLEAFKDTAQQQLSIIKAALDGLAANGKDTLLADALFRGLVTLQNSANYMGLDEIKVYAERTAGLVDQGRKSAMDFSVMVDLLRQECAIVEDMLVSALKKFSAPAPESVPAPSAPPVSAPSSPSSAPKDGTAPQAGKTETAKAPAPADKTETAKAPAKAQGKDDASSKASSTIRVDHEKLDHLMNLIGELIINRNRYTMLARNMEGNPDVDVTKVAQDLSETTYSMARISDDLQDTIMKVRMVPVSSVFSRFPRLVRDLSRKSGKEVDLILEGEETELDKSVVEVIGDPLVHLIRNSVDHGIESEEERRAAGKDIKGKVWLRAYYKGNSVAIEIEDDGKGIDPEKMREAAVRKGVATQDEARAMDDREAVDLIFAPGFSTAEKVTDISGRGVGMDVVRTNIKSLKGTINTFSEVGKGTRFTLSLPLTLAIIDALMVNVDGALYAIPLDAVSETTKIEAGRLTDVKGRKAVTLRGDVLGIISLAELLGVPCHMHEHEMLSVVVIQDNDRRLGLVVDRLLERQEIVIKPLGSYLGDLKGISGATIMGDGSVILIMDPHELYLMATSKAI
ncbi:MAG: chemotaxis protein CheA [Deltaproteobacteria bacterium]|jgi:two-component system chemotaxis sensor kinase CheA|nr:chemotaxis protein CheA [Deltaproteobacteria bacterium]